MIKKEFLLVIIVFLSQAKEAYKRWLSTNTEFPAYPEVSEERADSLEINEEQPHINNFQIASE